MAQVRIDNVPSNVLMQLGVVQEAMELALDPSTATQLISGLRYDTDTSALFVNTSRSVNPAEQSVLESIAMAQTPVNPDTTESAILGTTFVKDRLTVQNGASFNLMRVEDVDWPVLDKDAANKEYVDAYLSKFLYPPLIIYKTNPIQTSSLLPILVASQTLADVGTYRMFLSMDYTATYAVNISVVIVPPSSAPQIIAQCTERCGPDLSSVAMLFQPAVVVAEANTQVCVYFHVSTRPPANRPAYEATISWLRLELQRAHTAIPRDYVSMTIPKSVSVVPSVWTTLIEHSSDIVIPATYRFLISLEVSSTVRTDIMLEILGTDGLNPQVVIYSDVIKRNMSSDKRLWISTHANATFMQEGQALVRIRSTNGSSSAVNAYGSLTLYRGFIETIVLF